MAARLNRMHSDKIRERIRIAVVVQRLEANALGELKGRTGEYIEMTDGQIRSAIALMDRVLAKAENARDINVTVTLAELIAKSVRK